MIINVKLKKFINNNLYRDILNIENNPECLRKITYCDLPNDNTHLVKQEYDPARRWRSQSVRLACGRLGVRIPITTDLSHKSR